MRYNFYSGLFAAFLVSGIFIVAPAASFSEPLNNDTGMISREKTPDMNRQTVSAPGASQKDAYLYRALEYETNRDYTGALAEYRKLLRMDNKNFTVLNNVAYIYLRMGLDKESILFSQMALAINSNYIPALINLGIAYAGADNISAAEYYLDKAYSLDPLDQTAILNIAILHERRKNNQEASRYYELLMKLGNTEGILGLARIYERQGRIEESLRFYRSIQAIDSIDQDIQRKVRRRIMVLLSQKKNPGTDSGPERENLKNHSLSPHFRDNIIDGGE